MKVVIDEATEHRSIAPMKCISRAKKRRQKKKEEKKRERVKEARPHNDEYSFHAYYYYVTFHYRVLCGCEVCDDESCKASGARGPTIQSSIASQSLQLLSAASISESSGPCRGRKKGIVSSGGIS